MDGATCDFGGAATLQAIPEDNNKTAYSYDYQLDDQDVYEEEEAVRTPQQGTN